MTTPTDAYDLIDRFLRNNLGDDDYAEYSAALEMVRQPQAVAGGEPVGDVVVTTDDAGHIVAVTRQDEEGRILSVIATSAPTHTAPPPQAVREPLNTIDLMRVVMDAERYRAFIDCGQPVCFLGEEYFGKEALDAAIDAAKGGQHGAE